MSAGLSAISVLSVGVQLLLMVQRSSQIGTYLQFMRSTELQCIVGIGVATDRKLVRTNLPLAAFSPLGYLSVQQKSLALYGHCRYTPMIVGVYTPMIVGVIHITKSVRIVMEDGRQGVLPTSVQRMSNLQLDDDATCIPPPPDSTLARVKRFIERIIH